MRICVRGRAYRFCSSTACPRVLAAWVPNAPRRCRARCRRRWGCSRRRQGPRCMPLQTRSRPAILKVLSTVPLYRKCTRPLTFKNFCQGTTACAVLVCKETVFVGYVGDSQAVICRLNTPIVLNKPHKTSDDRERRCVLRVSIVCLSCSTLPSQATL